MSLANLEKNNFKNSAKKQIILTGMKLKVFYNQGKGLELWPLLNLAMWWNEFIREDLKG